MNRLATPSHDEPENTDINETLRSLSRLMEQAENQALDHDLKFLGYLLNMTHLEIKNEIGNLNSE